MDTSDTWLTLSGMTSHVAYKLGPGKGEPCHFQGSACEL
jgi:hypothetical protein